MKTIVAQIGAREHYAVARALHQQGRLAGLVTDWYAFDGKNRKQKAESRNGERETRGWATKAYFSFQLSIFQLFGRPGSAASAARAEGIPDELVHAFSWRSLFWKWQVRQMARQGRLYEAYAQTDAAFATAVARLKLPPHEAFFGYSYASLEMLEIEKQRGVLTVLDQIDPGVAEFRLVAEEMRKHPEIAGPPPEFPAANFERNRREWELVDIIIVNSEWAREAIIAAGADPAKIEILPLAYESPVSTQPSEFSGPTSDLRPLPSAPLRVLWLGQVNVRKGIHYLLEAARLLDKEKVQFDVVGPIGILPTAVATAPRNMTFHGPVSRDRAVEWYRQADVFVLPTLSDGFALTQLEALAHGLPAIVTPNCGRVVEAGKTGFIIPPRDPQALVDALLRFVRNPGLAKEMTVACRTAVKAYSVESFGNQLVTIIKKHLKTRPLTSDL
jgi:glycosyltransferase involved in cell wall biosynthesis